MHRFNDYDSFISVGFKPKAKDQKTFIEDLRDFDYIKDLESDDKLSIILESKHVRIGYQDSDLDPYYKLGYLRPFFEELDRVIVYDSEY